ncbi:hypothetical protein TRVL_05883 [Trypanosoma vivax]|nr:hypothetical protein TRVL_05883 [Trypanosoma vivax]
MLTVASRSCCAPDSHRAQVPCHALAKYLRHQSCRYCVTFHNITHMPARFHARCLAPCSFQVSLLQTNSRFVLVCVCLQVPSVVRVYCVGLTYHCRYVRYRLQG